MISYCLVWRLTQPYIRQYFEMSPFTNIEQHLGVGRHLMASLKSMGKAFSICSLSCSLGDVFTV